jgi:hypothetical protein
MVDSDVDSEQNTDLSARRTCSRSSQSPVGDAIVTRSLPQAAGSSKREQKTGSILPTSLAASSSQE